MHLAERADLIDRLRAAASAAGAGNGAMIAVTGEAGAGKTALVREALPDASWGYCEPLSTPRPLGPFRDIAREVLVPGPGEADDVAELRERLLDRLAADPTPLVIEDAHWIDDASADVLRFLGRRISATRGLIVVTFRGELLADHPLRQVLGELTSARGIVRLEVPALTRAAVAELVADTAVDVDEAYRLTNGNAFLVSQLVATADDVVTADVRDAVGARLTRLTPPARRLVELLSVVPGRAAAVLLGPDWADLDDAVALALLRVDGEVVEFRHELVRLAVEQGLTPGRRQEAHAEILRRWADAHAVEPAVIAFHARHAHDVERAYEHEVIAARRARALGSHRQAAEHFRRAVADAETLSDPEHRSELLTELSHEQWVIGQDVEATASAAQALELRPEGTDPVRRAAALRWMGRVTASEVAAYGYAQAAVALLEREEPAAELADAYAHLANNRMLARDLAAVPGWAGRAVELAGRFDAHEAMVVALQALGSARLLEGNPDGADDLRRAISIAEAAGLDGELGRAHSNIVSAAGEARLYELSGQAAAEALAYFLPRDLDSHAAYSRAWHARCLFEQGQWSAATVVVDQVLSGSSELTSVAALAAWCVRGRIRARRGDPQIWDALAEARRLADVTGSLQRLAPVVAGQAEAHWLAGEPEGATSGLRAAYDLAVERSNPWSMGELGFWMWRHGHLERLPAAAATPYRRHVEGDPIGAGQLWLDLGCLYEAADAWTDSADEESVRHALALFTELGARPGRQRAARRLRELGVRSIPRGPRESTAAAPDGLTRREREVLTWLRAGHTDAEIAARLHLSVKTVGHHVSAVLRKTGSQSRRDLQQR